jgi:hypothetical protein
MPDHFDIKSAFIPPLMSKSLHELNPASWMHERLVKAIMKFEESLDETKEIGARLVNFGPKETIRIEDVGYWGPDLVTFIGKNLDGNPVELMQHISQVNVLLVALPIEAEQPRRIGFILEAGLKKTKEEDRE